MVTEGGIKKMKCNCTKCDFCIKCKPTTDNRFVCCAADPKESDMYCEKAISKMIEAMKVMMKEDK